MPPDLSNFLDALTGRRWRYGRADCLLTVADWIKARHGVDPAAAWRGTYDDEEGALELIRRAGGVVALVETALAPHGFLRTVGTPAPGNICVVRMPTVIRGRNAIGHSGAICLTDKISAALTVTGGIVANALPRLAVWNT